MTVQVARVDLEARRIEFRLVRGDTRKALLAAPGERPKERKRGESVEERRARRAVVAARHPRDIDKRETARSSTRGKKGIGGARGALSRSRRRGR